MLKIAPYGNLTALVIDILGPILESYSENPVFMLGISKRSLANRKEQRMIREILTELEE